MIHDVVIAGAGPVGLFLACELRLAGLSVLVLEQAEDPRSPMKRLPFGRRGLWVQTLEAFHRRGLLDELPEPPSPQGGLAAHWQNQVRRPGGHFAGIPFEMDKVDTSAWPYYLPGAAGVGRSVEMESFEAFLAARADAMGVEVRRGSAVESIESSDEDVAVRTVLGVVRGRWLVGCDGGRSAVRKAAGIAFVGTEPEFTGYFVDIELAEPHALQPGRHHTPTGMYTYTPPGMLVMADFDGGACHRMSPITLDHVQTVLRRITGTDVTVTALRLASTWTDRAFQATTYRQGRVLLAGDAAHIHSPLGGQGLNLGLGDAMNLGWKLAATLRGDAPDDLLDTYTRERHPIGAQILDWSRAQVALMRPSPSSRALGAILRGVIDTPDGATYFAERMWGISLRYDLGGTHPLVGRSAPDIALADGTRLGEHLRSGRGLMLDFSANASLQTMASGWRDRLAYVASDAKERFGLSAMLVRPDGFVAWAADGVADAEEAARAVARWFGEPRQGG
ncbi:FAD-dependent monooxygenase [Dyella sp. BiH032]|uniref:FAD-dependent monooxygenase n=1 Tax=Dyella sp. BiH032 TaxID=3075430 RepID=UPI002893708B|nr:FAD-dependent monooxygenase [Dyella sp. BiH032]WNL44321.1 FAD-dependent monooxygenase [Dyella sp. BiH032]